MAEPFYRCTSSDMYSAGLTGLAPTRKKGVTETLKTRVSGPGAAFSPSATGRGSRIHRDHRARVTLVDAVKLFPEEQRWVVVAIALRPTL